MSPRDRSGGAFHEAISLPYLLAESVVCVPLSPAFDGQLDFVADWGRRHGRQGMRGFSCLAPVTALRWIAASVKPIV